MNIRTCYRMGCTRPVFREGECKGHYGRLCSLPKCTRAATRNGRCESHQPAASAGVLTPRQRRLLQRIVDGDCPRASRVEFNTLCSFDARLARNLQMESAAAADTREGYVITSLHGGQRGLDAQREVCMAVLADNPEEAGASGPAAKPRPGRPGGRKAKDTTPVACWRCGAPPRKNARVGRDIIEFLASHPMAQAVVRRMIKKERET